METIVNTYVNGILRKKMKQSFLNNYLHISSKNLLIAFCYLFCSLTLPAQNLVYSPSFTERIDTGYLGSNISVATNWSAVNTVDYQYTSIQGHSNFCGLTLNQPREYLIGKLHPLTPNEKHLISFSALADTKVSGFDKLGILFIPDSIHFENEYDLMAYQQKHYKDYVTGLKVKRNKKHEWVVLSTSFKASGQYRYFIIGYFGKQPLEKPVYLFMDDFEVIRSENSDRTLK
jgi:hypothetical protein